MKVRKVNAAAALGTLTASLALLAGMPGAHAQGAPGAGSFPGSFLVPGTQTSLKVGGYIKLDYTYDFGAQQGINGGAGPIGTALDSGRIHACGDGDSGDVCAAVPADSGHHIHGTSQMTASESRFNIETRTPTAYGELKTFIEGDFTDPNGLTHSNSFKINSNSYGFRLRQAYGTLGPFLAGQTASLFRDPDAEAETLDFGGPMSTGVTRQPQVRYTFDFGNGLTWAAALENPQTQVFSIDDGFNLSTFGAKQGDKIPDFTTAAVYSAPWGHLNLHAVLRDLYWHTGTQTKPPAEGISSSKLGWGIAFSGSWNVPIGKDALAWEAGYGEGAGRYINSDGPPTPDAFLTSAKDVGVGTVEQKLKVIPAWIVNANYTHFWTDTLRSNVAGSYWHQSNKNGIGVNQDETNDNASLLWKSAYTINVNLIWSPVPQTNFGVEFIRMQGKLESGQSGDLTRLQMSAQFKF
jgi:hypothetical protein